MKKLFQSGKFKLLAGWSDINLEYDLRGKSKEVTTSLVKDIGPVWKRVFRDKKTRPARKVLHKKREEILSQLPCSFNLRLRKT